MSDPVEVSVSTVVKIGRAAGSTPVGAAVALLVLAVIAVNAVAIAEALTVLVVTLVVLAVALVAGRVYLGRRSEQWRSLAGSDVQVNTGTRALEGRPCAACLPVRIPAAAVLLAPDGRALGVCTVHLHAAQLAARGRRALLRPGGAR